MEITLKLFLAIFHFYRYGTNTSEKVEKIASDEKRLSQMLLVRYSLHSHSITIKVEKAVY